MAELNFRQSIELHGSDGLVSSSGRFVSSYMVFFLYNADDESVPAFSKTLELTALVYFDNQAACDGLAFLEFGGDVASSALGRHFCFNNTNSTWNFGGAMLTTTSGPIFNNVNLRTAMVNWLTDASGAGFFEQWKNEAVNAATAACRCTDNGTTGLTCPNKGPSGQACSLALYGTTFVPYPARSDRWRLASTVGTSILELITAPPNDANLFLSVSTKHTALDIIVP